jgi:hypothetical protein
MSPFLDDVADNEPLMVALGRIALRSAELGKAVDDVTRQLDPAQGKKSRRLMLGRKLDLAQKTARAALSTEPELRDKFVLFCNDTRKLIKQVRNSPIHSTYLPDDVDDVVIKWDPEQGPEQISVDELNQYAEKLKATTRQLRQVLLHEIRNFQGLRAGR